jgi:hypothetical protein
VSELGLLHAFAVILLIVLGLFKIASNKLANVQDDSTGFGLIMIGLAIALYSGPRAPKFLSKTSSTVAIIAGATINPGRVADLYGYPTLPYILVIAGNPVPDQFWMGELTLRLRYREWDRHIQELEVIGVDQWHPEMRGLIGYKWTAKKESLALVGIELGVAMAFFGSGCIYVEGRVRKRLCRCLSTSAALT